MENLKNKPPPRGFNKSQNRTDKLRVFLNNNSGGIGRDFRDGGCCNFKDALKMWNNSCLVPLCGARPQQWTITVSSSNTREREREMKVLKYIQASNFRLYLNLKALRRRVTALFIYLKKREQVKTDLDIANNGLGIRNRWLQGVFCKKRQQRWNKCWPFLLCILTRKREG